MLFVLNKPPSGDTINLIKVLGGEEEKAVLLISDAVYYAISDSAIEELIKAGVKRIYAAKNGLEIRGLVLDESKVEVVDYEKIVDVLMEKYSEVISL